MIVRTFIVLSMWLAALASAEAAEPADYAQQRDQMVAEVEDWTELTSRATGVKTLDPKVLAAMREVPRHVFLPETLWPYAYGSHPLPVGYEQNLASPFLVALMTHLAGLEAGDVVFETGTGAGYHAAVLSRLGVEVYSVEVVEPLAARAAERLALLEVPQVHVRQGDGYYGWPEQGPYDAIIIKEALDHLPAPLLKQLKPGGRMVVPLSAGGGDQYLTVVQKSAAGALSRTRVLPVRFSPLQGGERT